MTGRSLGQRLQAQEQNHAGHTVSVNSYFGGRKKMQLNKNQVDV